MLSKMRVRGFASRRSHRPDERAERPDGFVNPSGGVDVFRADVFRADVFRVDVFRVDVLRGLRAKKTGGSWPPVFVLPVPYGVSATGTYGCGLDHIGPQLAVACV